MRLQAATVVSIGAGLSSAEISKRIYVSFDIDWAHDDVILDTLDLLRSFGVPATLFQTHQSPLLAEVHRESLFEFGIHPNFNRLLDGHNDLGCNSSEVICRLMEIVPQAKSVRSHSVTQSSSLLEAFRTAGLTHDCNHFIPSGAGIEVKPWLLWNGMIRVPYIWEDDVHLSYTGSPQPELEPAHIAQHVRGLKVFDFHPIHVFLNTESLDRYERTRPIHQSPRELIKHRYEGYGTRNRLIDLLEVVRAS